MIYIIKQEGLYQNKVNSSLVFTGNCKMGYWSLWFSPFLRETNIAYTSVAYSKIFVLKEFVLQLVFNTR